ncbi:MAG TPA: GNAT family N-acetyltransferase [Gillisia sp.]|nr:GNAT family N-acetyltransferase [Gillisia sp.]
MTFNIRQAEKKDLPQILELIQELATFEKEPDAVEINVQDLEKAGFGTDAFYTCFVAETEERIEGMALVYFRFSTWKGKTVHLEDLVVRQEKRGTGMGSALYKKVIAYSLEQGVKRAEWVVLDWNTPAVEFYERSGAKVLRDWDTVQMDENAMKSFLER